jgi:hypothetical protein
MDKSDITPQWLVANNVPATYLTDRFLGPPCLTVRWKRCTCVRPDGRRGTCQRRRDSDRREDTLTSSPTCET